VKTTFLLRRHANGGFPHVLLSVGIDRRRKRRAAEDASLRCVRHLELTEIETLAGLIGLRQKKKGKVPITRNPFLLVMGEFKKG
jgi:hypothetical protein